MWSSVLIHRLLDGLLPLSCVHCGATVCNPGLCGTCWATLSFLGTACCERCSWPLPVLEENSVQICGQCVANPPPFARTCAVLLYDQVSRDLLSRLKYRREYALVPFLAGLLKQKGAPFWPDADFLIPVPLHWTRLLSRRFNQSALLAARLEKLTGVLCLPSVLKRSRPTVSQGHLTKSQRFSNVKGAFSVSRWGSSLLLGKRIVLIDDVFTTGATLRACAQTLRGAGVDKIDVLTVARVVPGAISGGQTSQSLSIDFNG